MWRMYMLCMMPVTNDINVNPNLISELGFHTNSGNKNYKQYKLLGAYLDKYMSLDYLSGNLCKKP
jgi:hypothetical protein